MTVQTAPSGTGAMTAAIELVDLGIRACAAYQRTDLADRLAAAGRSLADPTVHVVVAGEFKKGKSSLVNALLGVNVCPVDDDVATAVPTYLRYGEPAEAYLIIDGDPPEREPVPLDSIRAHITKGSTDWRGPGRPPTQRPIAGVEVRVPRKVLATGLVIVDTPGVGGLGSAHAAASLTAISMADALVFVTDAGQEFTQAEIDFLNRARSMCSTVTCALTKIDFYPAWRTIAERNAGHLDAGIQIIPVASPLRALAVKGNDPELNTESGFAALVSFVNDQVAGGAASRARVAAAAEVDAVCEQLTSQFKAEQTALSDPATAQRVVDELTATRQRVEALRHAAARWNQTLGDGIADLNSDLEYDLRTRIRRVSQEAESAIEENDPADTWAEMEPWLQNRIADELLQSYTLLRRRADELSDVVAEHFSEASGESFGQLGVLNPAPLANSAKVEHKIDLAKLKVSKQAWVALRSAYSGTLMFTMFASLAGIALGPLGVGIGLVLGHKGLREEKKRLLQQRRAQALNATRRYCDEVSFMVGKDSRDTLRRIQRQLRDHYSTLAEELNRSNAEALARANEAARSSQADREQRLRDVEAELQRLRRLRERAQEVAS